MSNEKSLLVTVSNVPFSALFLAIIAVITWLIIRKKLRNAPPTESGWIPWLGCAISFGKAPLDFISVCRQKLGPVFTIATTGQRLTFVTELEDFNHFFQSDNVDFQQAVKDPVRHTANIKDTYFFKSHTNIHDMMKGKLAPKNLHQFSENLCYQFNKQISKLPSSGKGDLMLMVRRIMFAAVVNNLFGDEILPTTDDKINELEETFVKYDDGFEYGSQLPEMFMRSWTQCKYWLLSMFDGVVKKLETQTQQLENKTLLQSLVNLVDKEVAPNYSLLLLWATQANAIPITFWTLAFILSNKDIEVSLRQEIDSVIGDRRGELKLTEKDLQKVPKIKRAILEAIRLRSPGVITRKVVKPFAIRGFTVPAGDLLMLSPFWAHRNENLFPEPDSFSPDRWLKADLEKNVFLDGFVAFGGGRYQCPGRWFALMEIHMLIVLMLYNFDIKLVDCVPKQSSLHIVGSQQPEAKCHIVFTKKK